MNTLVLIPHRRRLGYAFFADSGRKALLELTLTGSATDAAAVREALDKIMADCLTLNAGPVELVAIRCLHGGTAFGGAAPVDELMLERFAALAAEAPVHVPVAHLLARSALELFVGAAVVMTFETAFFVNLPERERRYAIADGSVGRLGYHGFFHQAAAAQPHGRRPGGATRTVSLCLEPRPELVAMIDRRPIMVTSGATPLEGLPGETTCGDMDPTIVLELHRRLGWGPEQINQMLTRQSGLSALVGKRVRLGQVLSAFQPPEPTTSQPKQVADGLFLAQSVFAYRTRLAVGAAIAAMGGLDRIVLSGRYAGEAQAMAAWLADTLRCATGNRRRPIVVTCRERLNRIVADQAAAVALGELQTNTA